VSDIYFWMTSAVLCLLCNVLQTHWRSAMNRKETRQSQLAS